MKKHLILLVFLSVYLLNFAQLLSNKAQVHLITCDVGDEIYSLFGHTAIRVTDPEKNIDEVYNYGTFDGFDDNFELKFAQGKLNYWLSKDNIEDFLWEYQYFDRTVYQQTLNFTPQEVNGLYLFLMDNYNPENRKYLYDFFYDNCATKVRDVFQNVLGDKLIWSNHPWNNQYTFRQIIAKDLYKVPDLHLGIDLVLGRKIDVKASSYQLMFHPIYLMEIMSKSERFLNGEKQSLVAETTILYKGAKKTVDVTNWPLYISWVVFLFGAVITFFKLQKMGYVFDFFIFYLFAILGVVLLLMWFATDHIATKENYNVLWTLPVLFLFPVFYKHKSKRAFATLSGLYFLLFAGAFILPQEFNPAVIPLILTLGLRSYFNYRNV